MARLGSRHSCPVQAFSGCIRNRPGQPKTRRCPGCGSTLVVRDGLWGAFEWRPDGIYRPEDAKRTFTSHGVADRWATPRNYVVRWIPEEALQNSKA